MFSVYLNQRVSKNVQCIFKNCSSFEISKKIVMFSIIFTFLKFDQISKCVQDFHTLLNNHFFRRNFEKSKGSAMYIVL